MYFNAFVVFFRSQHNSRNKGRLKNLTGGKSKRYESIQGPSLQLQRKMRDMKTASRAMHTLTRAKSACCYRLQTGACGCGRERVDTR